MCVWWALRFVINEPKDAKSSFYPCRELGNRNKNDLISLWPKFNGGENLNEVIVVVYPVSDGYSLSDVVA